MSDSCEMPQEYRGDAASAIRLCNYKTKLGSFRVPLFVCDISAIADHDLPACLRDCRHQGHDLVEIHVGNLLKLGVRQILLRSEETSVDRLTVESPERIMNTLFIVFP